MKSSPQQIYFEPRNEIEEQYLAALNDLLNKKKNGDWQSVGEIVGIDPQYAEKAFRRVHSKYHSAVVDALKAVINQRETFMNNLINN